LMFGGFTFGNESGAGQTEGAEGRRGGGVLNLKPPGVRPPEKGSLFHRRNISDRRNISKPRVKEEIPNLRKGGGAEQGRREKGRKKL